MTNSPELEKKLRLGRSHGITRDLMDGDSHGPWYYQQISLGYNYRITDLQAALGLRQMEELDAFVARRHHLAKRYNEALANLPVILPWQHPDNYSAYHLYVIGVAPEKRRQVVEFLHSREIMVNVHYIPVHTQPYYRRFGFRPGDFPAAEAYYAGAVSLPMYFGLSEGEQDLVVAALAEVLA
jgi:dTDP-4-amino-4,6-dideoxygalactose transaminase